MREGLTNPHPLLKSYWQLVADGGKEGLFFVCVCFFRDMANGGLPVLQWSPIPLDRQEALMRLSGLF